MDEEPDLTDIPVLMVCDLDPTWDKAEIDFFWQKFSHLTAELTSLGHPLFSEIIQDSNLALHLEKYNPDEVVVFNLCETLPGASRMEHFAARMIEEMGFTFTGARERAILYNEEKVKIKKILQRCGIPTPAWKLCHSPQVEGWKQFPAIVKPALEHWSLGVDRNSVATTPAELERQVAYILDTFQEPALLEDFIDGREFRVSVLGNDPPRMLPPAEMDYAYFDDIHDRMLNWESKWDVNSVYYNKIKSVQPAPLSDAELKQLEEVALATYQVTRCRDYGGLDIRLRDNTFYVLEANTNPEIFPGNSMSRGAELIGLPFGRFASHIINLAARRHPIFKKRYPSG
jgi:D-alanine-D-alanine ligase